ncbi:MAG: oxidoreductase [Dehalococcoidia bacterium]
MSTKWSAADIPPQHGRVAVVTGANSGIGLEVARELTRAGAEVVLACRNLEKGAAAARDIEATTGTHPQVSMLDLGNLASVKDFALRFAETHSHLDLLLNNAGVMAPPRRTTADGFELQFGTNHLGHFALTCQLIRLMQGRDDARVVTVSSGAHRGASMNFDDLQGERGYARWRAYGQSKLANLLFMRELGRRLAAAGSSVRSVAAHPGYAATNLQSAAAPRFDAFVMSIGNVLLAQSAAMGALPSLHAATQPGLESGTYIGPDGVFEGRGHPRVVAMSEAARDQTSAERLWAASEELTGVRLDIG